jgi:DNA-directed RNA polymerases I, II, and III subunit RPABC1
MSLLLVDNYVKRVGIVYLNVLEMLEARGIDKEIVMRNTVDKYLSERIRKFILEKDSVYIDISINDEGKKYAVKFLDKNAIRLDGKSGLSNIWKEASMAEDLGENDELIIVFLDNSFSRAEMEIIEDFESNHPNTRLLSYKHLMFNITKHELVPKHVLYKGNKFELFETLMIKSSEQLPFLLKSDPIARYFNFRRGDIIQIHRPVKANKMNIVYRLVN